MKPVANQLLVKESHGKPREAVTPILFNQKFTCRGQ